MRSNTFVGAWTLTPLLPVGKPLRNVEISSLLCPKGELSLVRYLSELIFSRPDHPQRILRSVKCPRFTVPPYHTSSIKTPSLSNFECVHPQSLINP